MNTEACRQCGLPLSPEGYCKPCAKKAIIREYLARTKKDQQESRRYMILTIIVGLLGLTIFVLTLMKFFDIL